MITSIIHEEDNMILDVALLLFIEIGRASGRERV